MTFGRSKATLKITGEHNRRMVFQLLRRHGRLSRQQISDETALHRSTLSKIMSEFLSRRLVREVGRVEPPVKRVGKRQMLMEIRGDVGWTVGIGINLDRATFLVADAAGRPQAESHIEIGDDLTRLPDLARRHLDEWMPAARRPHGRFLGAGAGVPGIVDAESGVVLFSNFFRLRHYPLAHELGRALGVPACVDNDARLEAKAHLNQPGETASGDFIFLYTNHRPAGDGFVLSNFGSAVVIDGNIYRGAHQGACELWGRLEIPCSPPITGDDLKAIALENAPMNDRLQAAADTIAPYVATLAGFVDPDHVIIGGAISWRNRSLLGYLQAKINEKVQPWYDERRIVIEPAGFPGQGTAYGAALTAFDHIPIADLDNRPSRG